MACDSSAYKPGSGPIFGDNPSEDAQAEPPDADADAGAPNDSEPEERDARVDG